MKCYMRRNPLAHWLSLKDSADRDIAFDPTDSQILYLSTGDPDAGLDVNEPDFASTPYQSRGLYKSLDKGLTWSTNPIGVSSARR